MNKLLLRRPAIGTALLLLVPLVMTVLDRNQPEGDGWHWGPDSFLVMGSLLFAAGVLYEWLASKTTRPLHRAWLGGAIFALVVAIWSELAVDALSRGMHFLLQ